MRHSTKSKNRFNHLIHWLKDWLRDVLPAVLLAYLFFGVLFRLTVVVGSSMEPTLRSGSLVLTQSAFYHPKRGDIVVCRPEKRGKILIKRVIGVSGDTVDIDFQTGEVKVNGLTLDEPYILERTHRNDDGMQFPVVVEEGRFFLLGDNRNNSRDIRSLSVGQVSEDSILSGYVFTILP